VVDEIKGRVPEVYIALKPGLQPSPSIVEKVNKAIETIIGKIARHSLVRELTSCAGRASLSIFLQRYSHKPRCMSLVGDV
jgi:hypothetical protein